MSANAYKLRWDCEESGCFNAQCRLKFDVFSDCFPGRINFSDVDGIVERNGKALMLEWKRSTADMTRGQQRMFASLTLSGDISVICIAGDAATMQVHAVCAWNRGRFWPWQQRDMTWLKGQIRNWFQSANSSLE